MENISSCRADEGLLLFMPYVYNPRPPTRHAFTFALLLFSLSCSRLGLDLWLIYLSLSSFFFYPPLYFVFMIKSNDKIVMFFSCKTEPLLSSASQTTPSLAKRKSTGNSSTMTVSFEPDCYSSTDYINYCITRNNAYSTSTLPLGCHMNRSTPALNDIHLSDFTRSLRLQKASTSSNKFEGFNPPLHKRTRSFDSATQ